MHAPPSAPPSGSGAPADGRAGPGVLVPVAAAWLAAYAAWSIAVPPFTRPWQLILDEAALLPLRAAIAVLALSLGRRAASEPAARRGFTMLGAGFVISTTTSALRVAAGGGSLHPLVGLLLAIPQATLVLGGLWQLARLRRDRGASADWLDASAIVLALYLVTLYLADGAPPLEPAHLGLRRWLFLLYLVTDLTAMVFVAAAWFRRPAGISRGALGFLVLGFAVIGMADLVYDQRIQTGTWRNGGLLDAAVGLGFVLLLAGLDRQRRRPLAADESSPTRPGRDLVAPLTILAATGPMLHLAWEEGEHGLQLSFHVTGVVVLLALVLVRQHLDRRRLTQVAQERAAADARFRSLVQRSSDAILHVSTDHVVRWASPSAGELAGALPSLLVGRRIGELAHPEDRDRLSVFLANASQPFARNAALRWRLGRPGQWHDVESVVSDLTGDPAVGGYVLNTRNVTERVRLEQQLRQSQKLEAVGRLAGGIAHDFNNILAAIISNAQLVREGLPPEAAHAADLLEIEQTAQRGAALTRRLLSFSRPETGELQVHALTDAIRGMEPLLRRLLVGQVDLQMDLGDDPLLVRTAEGQLEQILMNLAINARDAMPEGGTVRVRTRERVVPHGAAALPGVLPGRWAELEVRDNGVGMDADTMGRLFEPFFTTKPSGLGTGLGLTTVRGIVRALGGHVQAESAPGAGTTMRVLLPLSQSSHPAAAPTRRSPMPGMRVPHAVLVVDDEAALRSAMERLLARQGFEVLGAGSGPEALQLLEAREWRVDLVVSDMVMPGMGGREFVRAVRARRPGLPVLCISGHMEWDADGTDEPDAPWRPERLLAKPFAFEDFLQRVRDALTLAVGAP